MLATDWKPKMWTPYQINIILHYHCCAGQWPLHTAPIFNETVCGMVAEGLLQPSGMNGAKLHIYETTERGKALVEMWCATPIPEMRYVDPRFDFAISLANGADKP